MTRPYIICHMLTSINGKISGSYMNAASNQVASRVYETVNERYHSQAWLCGRVTMEENFTHFQKPVVKETTVLDARNDFVAAPNAEMYIVSADPSGKVGWQTNTVQYENRPDAHVIEILTNKASDAYVSYLQERKISYIFAGDETINCTLAVQKLAELFGIKTLMLSGGGVINWAFLEEKLVDELSIIVAPVTDGETNTHTIFENSNKQTDALPIDFKLKQVEVFEDDTLWLRYQPTDR